MLNINNYSLYLIQPSYIENIGKIYKINGVADWDLTKTQYLGAIQGEDNFNILKKMNIPIVYSTENLCVECFKNKIIKDENYSFYLKNAPTYNINSFVKIIKNNFNQIKSVCCINNRINIVLNLCYEHGRNIQSDIENFIEQLYSNKQDETDYIDISDIKEYEIEKLIINNLEQIEKGMSFVKKQYNVKDGRLDIIAKDKNNNICIIEVKNKSDDIRLVFQSAYYPTMFKEPVRMITIAPDYSDRIYYALNNLKNVELFTFSLNKNKKINIKRYKK